MLPKNYLGLPLTPSLMSKRHQLEKYMLFNEYKIKSLTQGTMPISTTLALSNGMHTIKPYLLRPLDLIN
jgi:hypothetical protein